MSFEVHESYDKPRGCGYRKQGGFYLLGGEDWRTCDKLPAPITLCRCCGHEIRQTRGIQRIKPAMLWGDTECAGTACVTCKINRPDAFLMWVGAKYYTPSQFVAEANTYEEVSKRIASTNGRPMLPEGFVVGESAILLAHPQAITTFRNNGTGKLEPDHQPGVFMAYVPSRVEYVVRDGDTDEYLQGLADMHVRLVRVVQCGASGQPLVKQLALENGNEEDE